MGIDCLTITGLQDIIKIAYDNGINMYVQSAWTSSHILSAHACILFTLGLIRPRSTLMETLRERCTSPKSLYLCHAKRGCRGRVIKELDLRRTDLVITTKLFWGHKNHPNGTGLSRKQCVDLLSVWLPPTLILEPSIIEGTQLSLDRLGLDYVDVIFAHRPDSSGMCCGPPVTSDAPAD